MLVFIKVLRFYSVAVRSIVLEDVLGLEDTFWSPWPWSRSQVLSIGLEASSPRKLPCPRLEDSTIFWIVEILLQKARNVAENLRRPFFVFFNWRSPEKLSWRPAFVFGEHLRLCPWSLALVSSIPFLGLERVCSRKGCSWPWPRNFFVSLAWSL